MEFGRLPPEITSARMYSGPGAAPLFAAATGWDAVATELRSAAVNYRALLGSLTTDWAGPSSVAMNAASARYTQWLTTTAAQAEHTANHARAAAAAYETALAIVVAPPVIAANRAHLAALVATNVLGQNTAAIMAAEAHYVEMWAQDAHAMHAYYALSQAATDILPTFTAPVPIVNPAGLATQAGAVAQSLLTPDVINAYLEAFISSGPDGLPLQLLSLFATRWGLDPAGPKAAPESAAPAREVMARPPLPTPSAGAASPSLRVADGNRLGTLTVPPSWGRLPTPSEPTWSRVTPLPTAEQMPSPLPLAAGVGGTPHKQPRPEPEYGVVPTVVRRHPHGG
jgi:PPE family